MAVLGASAGHGRRSGPQPLETFRALGIEFVSFSEKVDTSTPTGKMVFTVLAAVAELERSLIVERVKAGLWTPGRRESGSADRGRAWMPQGSPLCVRRASGGRGSRPNQGSASELSTALLLGVPKLRKGILERPESSLPMLHLFRGSGIFARLCRYSSYGGAF